MVVQSCRDPSAQAGPLSSLGALQVWSADLDDTKYTLINAIYDKVMD